MISNATIKYGTTRDDHRQALLGAGHQPPGRRARPRPTRSTGPARAATSTARARNPPSVDLPGRRLRRDHDAVVPGQVPDPDRLQRTSPSRASTSRTPPTAGGTAWNDPSAERLDGPVPGRRAGARLEGHQHVRHRRRDRHPRLPRHVNVPANGAMYFEQSVIVSDGSNKVDSCASTVGPARPRSSTAASPSRPRRNVYVGGNISYASPGRRRARPDRRQRGDHRQVHADQPHLARRLAGPVRPVAHLRGQRRRPRLDALHRLADHRPTAATRRCSTPASTSTTTPCSGCGRPSTRSSRARWDTFYWREVKAARLTGVDAARGRAGRWYARGREPRMTETAFGALLIILAGVVAPALRDHPARGRPAAGADRRSTWRCRR